MTSIETTNVHIKNLKDIARDINNCPSSDSVSFICAAAERLYYLQDRLTAAESKSKSNREKLEQLVIYMAMIDAAIGIPDGSDTYDAVADLVLERDQLRAQLAEQTMPSESVQFQAAASGLWYENPMACGEVSSIKVNGKVYYLPKVEQVSVGGEPVAQRITEQDARSLALSAFRHMSQYGGRTVDTWLEEDCRTLLAKLNEHLWPVESGLQERLTITENRCAQQVVHIESLDRLTVYLNELNASLLAEREQVATNKADVPATQDVLDCIYDGFRARGLHPMNHTDLRLAEHAARHEGYAAGVQDAAVKFAHYKPLPPLKDE